jgi:glycosyltransferase involved in cell wall biosynthesis
MRPTDLTVVLPTRNEAHNVDRFLDSLPAAVPLVVVDASDDDTPERLAARRPDARIARQRGTIALARQHGASLAGTSWLLFTDADVEFEADYFARVRDLVDDDVVFGPKLSRDAFQAHYRHVTFGQRLLDRAGIPAATGSNLLIRAAALRAVGGFDVALPCNEDSEIVWRLRAAGFRTRFDDTLRVYAFDHRRLESGSRAKAWHSALRCALLYSGLLPQHLRRHDWGYWSRPRAGTTERAHEFPG